MITLSLATLAKVTDGELIVPEKQTELSLDNLVIDDLTIDDLVTDSRAIVENSDKVTAFLALKGPSFDGHRFAQQVITQGCQLLIVDHHLSEVTDTAQLVVSDTRIALGKIAAFVKKEVAP